MSLETCDLCVRRRAAAVLTFPDIKIGAGQRVLLLGPSGCGKTTLLSVVAGLLKPDAGRVTFRGQDLYGMKPAARDHLRGREMGFVFQTLHLLPSLTVRQNIVLAADMAGVTVDGARVEALLETLGIADKAARKPSALSQGEQQRAAIARAVVNKPSLVIADEPTSALDDENARKVMDILMKQVQDSQASLLVATHDSRIAEYFDTVIHLESAKRIAA